MKNKIFIVTILIFIIVNFIYEPSFLVNAKTLNDLMLELDEIEEEDKENKTDIKKTEQEISQIKNNITKIYADMDQIAKDIIRITEEIKELDQDIKEKDTETKELMKFLQMSNGNNLYIEYILGADSLTDFIYRIAVVEQLSKYNNKLITEMNEMIGTNNQKKEDLRKRNEQLKSKQANLRVSLNSLGKEKESLYEYSQDLAEEIKTAREVIDMYKSAGCGLHEDIDACANRMLPPDTRFSRPLLSGKITSGYGFRTHPIYHDWRFHDGIDITNYDKYNTKIYSTANGKVAKIGYTDEIGHYVIIHHYINGENYTSQYLHLKPGSIQVKEGELVTRKTVLGIMGTSGTSTGEHLHFAIATGLRYKDYWGYYDFVSRTINPCNVINFPFLGIYWNDRITKYN